MDANRPAPIAAQTGSPNPDSDIYKVSRVCIVNAPNMKSSQPKNPGSSWPALANPNWFGKVTK